MTKAETPHNLNIRTASLQLQPRDLLLLRGLFESRVMSQSQVTQLFFDGRVEAAKKRLQRLKAHRLIAERPRRVYEPSVLFLTKAGFVKLLERELLQDYPRLTWHNLEKRVQVSPFTLKHELAVMDVKAALMVAIQATGSYEVAEFTTWPVLSQFTATRPKELGQYVGREVLVKPDGFMRVTDRRDAAQQGNRAVTPQPNHPIKQHRFYLELDRSTENQATLADKAHGYRDYFQSGGLAQRLGYPRDQYKAFGFRVLMVFQNAERRNNCAETLLRMQPPVLSQVWLTTFEEITQDPLGAIWVKPIDYRAVTQGTAYDISRTRTGAYRREVEREVLVEKIIVKVRLLEV